MFKGMSQFKALFDEFVSGRLTGNEQLITLHINIAMNNAHWAKTIRLSDNSLLALLNQYDSTGKPLTLESVRRIKQKLKNKGLIDFTSGKGNQVSEYRLVKLYADAPCPHDTNDPADTAKQSPGDLLYSNNYNNSITEDIKTIRQEDINNNTTTNAHATASNISTELEQCWIDNVGERPRGGIAIKLIELEQVYGTQVLVDAINKAAVHNKEPRLPVAFVMRILENPEKSKGEMRNGRSDVIAENRRNAWDD